MGLTSFSTSPEPITLADGSIICPGDRVRVTNRSGLDGTFAGQSGVFLGASLYVLVRLDTRGSAWAASRWEKNDHANGRPEVYVHRESVERE